MSDEPGPEPRYRDITVRDLADALLDARWWVVFLLYLAGEAIELATRIVFR